MEVLLKDKLVNVEIVRKNNKNIYFRVINENLVVTCNNFVTTNYLKELIKKNENSLLRMYNRAILEEKEDAFFNYLGEQYTILYDYNVKEVTFNNDIVITKDIKMLDKFYNQQVISIFNQRVEQCKLMFDDISNFKLRFRKMKTRWGVNNVRDRIITLNTELLKKEISLLDYVIIHEICHFYQANHSAKFWEEVSKRYPYYKLARKKLRGDS